MKNVIYITFLDLKDENSGIAKKVLNQVKTLRNSGFCVSYSYVDSTDSSFHLVEENSESKEIDYCLGIETKAKTIKFSKLLISYLEGKRFGGAFFRHTGRIDPWILKILSKLKSSGTKILYEFPTFPYDDMRFDSSISELLDSIIDKLCRRSLKKYVNGTLTYSKDETIFGVKAIQIVNGIEVDGVKEKRCNKKKQIDLVAVSTMFPYHGYERIIEGLSKYYSEKKDKPIVMLHFVGEGRELKKYKELVQLWKLNDCVVFHGKCFGEKLDEIYDICDIGLSCFGDYLFMNQWSSSLKVREYLAKGLPVVSATEEDVFVMNPSDYCLMVKNDFTEVNIDDIVYWYLGLVEKYNGEENLVKCVREFAKKTVDMKVVLRPVIDFWED